MVRICNHKKHKEISCFDSIRLYECEACGIVFSNKYWAEVDARRLYEDYYKNEIGGKFNFSIECIIRIFRFFRAFKIFTLSSSAKEILDIGSGRGFMLYFLKKYYKYNKCIGTQISKNALIYSREKLELEIYDKDLLDLSIEEESFDIITAFHVLEHVPKPEEYIEKTLKLLKSGGKVVIEVPNFNSWTRKLTNKYWLSLDLCYHIYFFTPETLLSLLKKHSFRVRTVHTFSLEYSTFISAQSIVSLITKTDHLFFNNLQTAGISFVGLCHTFLFILLTPLCFLINLALYFSKRGEVLLVVAEKS